MLQVVLRAASDATQRPTARRQFGQVLDNGLAKRKVTQLYN
jgi:hypothetical protein